MRDSARIRPLLAELGAYWGRNPDLRLGQIVTNATVEFGYSHPYPIEDEKLMEGIRALAARAGAGPVGGFYVQCVQRGELALWWKANHKGYTFDLDEAGFYDKLPSDRGIDRLVPVEMARGAVRSLVEEETLDDLILKACQGTRAEASCAGGTTRGAVEAREAKGPGEGTQNSAHLSASLVTVGDSAAPGDGSSPKCSLGAADGDRGADRCPNCDKPVAGQREYDAIPEGGGTEFCWAVYGAPCEPYDWRAEAMRLRGEVRRTTPPCESHEDIGVGSATRRHTIRELATTDSLVEAAVQLVDHCGYSWPVAMEHLVIEQSRDRARLINELTKHMRICCPPILVAAPIGEDIMARIDRRVADVIERGGVRLGAETLATAPVPNPADHDGHCLVCGESDCNERHAP